MKKVIPSRDTKCNICRMSESCRADSCKGDCKKCKSRCCFCDADCKACPELYCRNRRCEHVSQMHNGSKEAVI